MHAVNGLLRAELAEALARLDAAESPAVMQRRPKAPQEANAGAAGDHAAHAPERCTPERPYLSHKIPSSAQRAAQNSSPGLELAVTGNSSPRGQPWAAELPRSPNLSNIGAGTSSKHTQLQSMPHAGQSAAVTQLQSLHGSAETCEQSGASCPRGPEAQQAVPVLDKHMALLLISMTALQLRLDRQIAAEAEASRTEDLAEQEDAMAEMRMQREQQISAAVEVARAELSQEHAQQLDALQQRLQEDHECACKIMQVERDAACQHLQEGHEDQLKALQASHNAELETMVTRLTQESAQKHAHEVERLERRLKEQHAGALQALEEQLQQENAALMNAQHRHTCAGSGHYPQGNRGNRGSR